MHSFAKEQQSFNVELRNFDRFDKRVIFITVGENELLFKMQRSLHKLLEKSPILSTKYEYRFHPHLTIAHKDLAPEFFLKAWNYFSTIKYERTFRARAISLLKHENRMGVRK